MEVSYYWFNRNITYRNLADTVVNINSASYTAGYNAGKPSKSQSTTWSWTDVDGVTTKTLFCTFNQLSSVVGIQSIGASSNGGYVSKFAILSLSISGNTVTAKIKHDSNGSDNNITYTIKAIGY